MPARTEELRASMQIQVDLWVVAEEGISMVSNPSRVRWKGYEDSGQRNDEEPGVDVSGWRSGRATCENIYAAEQAQIADLKDSFLPITFFVFAYDVKTCAKLIHPEMQTQPPDQAANDESCLVNCSDSDEQDSSDEWDRRAQEKFDDEWEVDSDGHMHQRDEFVRDLLWYSDEVA